MACRRGGALAAIGFVYGRLDSGQRNQLSATARRELARGLRIRPFLIRGWPTSVLVVVVAFLPHGECH